jgi:hypothetical protein
MVHSWQHTRILGDTTSCKIHACGHATSYAAWVYQAQNALLPQYALHYGRHNTPPNRQLLTPRANGPASHTQIVNITQNQLPHHHHHLHTVLGQPSTKMCMGCCFQARGTANTQDLTQLASGCIMCVCTTIPCVHPLSQPLE